MIWSLPQRLFSGPLQGPLSGKNSRETERLARWHFLLSPRKKGARKFFSRFQEASIELFTFSAVWREKCTLTRLRSHLVRKLGHSRTVAQPISFLAACGREVRSRGQEGRMKVPLLTRRPSVRNTNFSPRM